MPFDALSWILPRGAREACRLAQVEETRMIHGRNCGMLGHALLLAAGLGLAGCSSTQRNLSNTILVTTTPALAEAETRLVLELRHTREELSLDEIDAFLASDRATKLSPAERFQLRERGRVLRLTLPQARQEFADGLAITRPDPGKALADGNIVIYVAGKSAVHVLFSRAEVGQLLASRECADDLTTIHHTHPEFAAARLCALRNRVAASDLDVANLSPAESELERLKTEAAARVLERYLRDGGLPLPNDLPLLTYGTLSPARSPRLSAALEDSSVVERILQDHDANTLRALIFLINRDVIKLPYP